MTRLKPSGKKYERTREKSNWDLKHFVDEVGEIMKEQEGKNPALKELHARLDPKWRLAGEKIRAYVAAASEEDRGRLRDEILNLGSLGTLALLEFISKRSEGATEH